MYSTLIVGAGPGGTGPLVWAAQNGCLENWLRTGVAVLDRSPSIGGTIGRYIINSDSLGGAYLECLDAPPASEIFAPLRKDPATLELRRMRDGFPPLPCVGQYLDRLGARLAEALRRDGSSAFLPRCEVRSLRLRQDGSVAAEATRPSGETVLIEARTAILALGGRQILPDTQLRTLLPAVSLDGLDRQKLMLSDTLFTAEGLAQALMRLGKALRHRVAILGGRHSAFSSAWLLTERCPPEFFAEGEITIICRRQAPIFYATRAEAEADGCSVTERDICPVTRRVHRFSGMRGDGRELWRRIHQRPGTVAEKRVRVVQLAERGQSPAALNRFLDDAALVVLALGYRSATIPIFDSAGQRLSLRADHGGPAVGSDARLLLSTGGSVRNIFGIGLGTGYRPWGHMGGEENLEGQINSLWLYQNHIGEVVYRGVQECLQSRRELADA